VRSDLVGQTLELATIRPEDARQALQGLYEQDKRGFLRACAPLIRDYVDTAGGDVLVSVLLANGLLTRFLLDGSLIATPEAASLLKLARHVDPLYESKTMHDLLAARESPRDLFRFLDVLTQASQTSGLTPILEELSRHSDPHVRSKAALLLGRAQKNFNAIRSLLNDADKRVAANAIESLWGESSDEALEIFRSGLSSGANRVVGNAALGLYLAGDTDCFRVFAELVGHSEDLFRASGLKVVEFSRDPRLLPLLVDAMGKAAAQDRQRIFAAIRTIRESRDRMIARSSLRVHISHTRCSDDGTRRIRFAVVDGETRQVLTGRQIIATNAVPHENGSFILSYRCRASSPHAAVSLRVIAPAALAESLAPVVALRRPTDNWRVVAYGGNLSAERTLRDALRELQKTPSPRHLVITDATGCPASIRPADWLEAITEAKIRVHTVLASDAPSADLLRVESLSRETEGIARRYEGSPESVVEAIASTAIGSYELTYARPPLEEFELAEVKLQIYLSRGYGEASGFVRIDEES
jgi:hypothetical protein